MLDAFDTKVPDGDYPLLVEYPTPLRERRHATGFGLYDKLGIAREDKPARAMQFRKNFAFFDAPAVLFLFAHDALGVYSVLDAGIYLGAILLAATNVGVQTCSQAALASFPDVVRKHFDVPERYKLLCGVALGYAADDVVNSFRPARLSVEQMTIPPRS
jgi:nitroreductase